MTRAGDPGFAVDGRSAGGARIEELTEFVCAAAALFLVAEQGANPAVQTYYDALHYVSTSLSVGYANIFPVTQAGKAIGAVVQMVGPALSSKALERDQPDKLDEVLVELRKITAALPAAADPRTAEAAALASAAPPAK